MTAFHSIERVPSAVLDLTTPELSAELADVETRLHVLRGLVDALGRLDEVNQAVQSSATKDDALQALRKEPFRYSEEQATALLSLPMVCQSTEEVKRFRQEMDYLLARRASLREQLTEVLSLHWFG